MAKQLTTATYRSALQAARERHDLKFQIDHPKPEPKALAERTGIEKALSSLWIVWGVLGIAGGVISLPHTLSTVLDTVNLSFAVAVAYSIAVFLGVELALISVALVSALKAEEHRRETGKQASLAGLINTLAGRVGLRPVFDLSHLPERRAATGAVLVLLLFVAALTFNMSDALKDLPLLEAYGQEIHLLSRLMAGALGPGLLLIAGHRFAHEVVRAMTARQRLERAYDRALDAWQAARDQSWQESGDQWIEAVVASKLGQGHWWEELTGDTEEEAGLPFGTNGNGHSREGVAY